MSRHPLALALGLARAADAAGARIHEGGRVLGWDEGRRLCVRVESGEVVADHLVLACNGYLGALHPRVAARTMPINSFVIATEPLPQAMARALIRDDTAVSDSRFVVNYFRLSADRRLIFGGGETYGYDIPRDIAAFVRPHMLRVYPQLRDVAVDYGWGGSVAITACRLPYFARLSPRIWTAGGYSGQGVGLATLAGPILAEAITGDGRRMDLMARIPSTPFPGGQRLRRPLLALAMAWYALRDRL